MSQMSQRLDRNVADGDPRFPLAERRATRSDDEVRLTARERLLARIRLAALLAAGTLAWAAATGPASLSWVLVAAAAACSALIVAVSLRHLDVRRARERAAAGRRFYERALSRLDGTWRGAGDPGSDLVEALDDRVEHAFASDLDLFGSGSLYEMMESPRSPTGRHMLASWLLAPATTPVVLQRQAAVAELAADLDLREELASCGLAPRRHERPALVRWAEGATSIRAVGLSSAALLSTTTLTLILAAVGMLAAPGWLAGIALLGHAGVALRLRARVDSFVGEAEAAAQELATLLPLLDVTAALPARAPLLQSLRGAVAARAPEDSAEPAKQAIARLFRLLHALDAERNLIFAPIAFWTLWRIHLACALERWRERHGTRVRAWVDAVGTLEALAALAGNLAENPDHTFPEIVESAPPSLEALQLGHPLLRRDRCVRNDLTLDGERRGLVVSGSNMSGKSTLLRALGSNVVLAQAGGAVRASRLRLSPLVVAASIRIQDSLLDGRSRFQAEIERVRLVMRLAESARAESRTLLFLLDELLAGTNSEDRRIGAEGIVRGLLARGAIGLVTTHDLALAAMADAPASGLANVHFEEHIEGGRMSFDYRMRPGPVRRGNAVELMRLVGLDV